MKQMKNLLGLLLLAAIIGFTSCEEEGEDPILPSLSVEVSPGMTVEPGDTVMFAWEARDGDAKLETFTIEEGNQFVGDWNAKEIPNDMNETYMDTVWVLAPENNGAQATFTFTVTDKDGESKSVSKTITAEATDDSKDLESFSAKLLYAPAKDGSSETLIDLESGSTFTLNNGANNSSSIDLGYYYGSNNEATLVDPNTYPSSVYDISWSTLNETELQTTSANFAELSTSNDITTQWSNNASNEITNLSVNDVLLFKTTNNSYGAIKVQEISGTYNQGDYIKLDIKVE